MRYKLNLIFLLSLLFFQNHAFAECECGPKPSIDAAFKEASVVFVGRVDTQGKQALKPGYNEIKFNVFKKYKGFEELPKVDSYVFYTPEQEEKCGMKFQNGYEYVVYAIGNPAFLQITKCLRSEVLEKATADDERLQQIAGKAQPKTLK